jgi:hypothetical protein
MKRNTFINILIKKKYIFTDTGENIIIHGVDPTKRLNSTQTYYEIDLGNLKEIPPGVIFDEEIETIRMSEISLLDIPKDTLFLKANNPIDSSSNILLKNGSEYRSDWIKNMGFNIERISPVRMLQIIVKRMGRSL